MRDLYEVFNDLNLEEEKDLEVMNDLEKQKWKKKLRKEIQKPMKTGKKVAVSAGCLGIAAGLFFTMSDSEVMAKARKAVEDSYRSIAIWIIGTPRENDYVQEVYGKDTANGREVTIVDMIADEDLLQISYKDRDLTIENFEAAGYLDEDMEKRTDSMKYSLDAQLLVDGEIVGEGWINSYNLRFNTNAIDNTFSIYTGDYGCDLSEVEEAELILKERYYPDTEEWRFHLNLQKRNLKNTTREQELDETIQPIKQTDLIYGIEDRPPFKDALFAAVQHLLAIFVAIITPPLIIASALKLDLETTGFLVSMALLSW